MVEQSLSRYIGMTNKIFLGTILAMFVALTGHPWIALFIFWLSII
jgi:hypothetical protein